MQTTLARLSSLVLLSSLLFSTACNDNGGDPTAVWDDERVRNQGTLTVSPSTFQIREGESVTLHADYQGTADFSPSRVDWTVRPAGAGTVENGVFTADVAGEVMVEGRFSSLADTAEATIRPELIDFVPVSDSSITAAAGQVVSDSVEVKVLGRQSAPVPGEVVEFEVVDGDGNVSRHRRVTDANGTARVAWLLGPRPGDNRLRSKVERFEFEFHARGRPDRASARLRIAAAKEHEGTVGELLPAPLVVEARDAQGNPLPDMMVRWDFPDGRGMVDAKSASSADTVLHMSTDDRGRATVYWQLGGRAGSQEVVASFPSEDLAPGGNGNGNGRDKSVKFEASAKPGHLASLVVSPTPVSMSVGNTVTLATTGVDEYGNTVEVSDASWSSSDASVASVDGSGAVTAVAPGMARIEAKRGPARGYADITVVEPEGAAVTAVVASHGEILFDRFEESVSVQATAHDAAGAVVGDAELAWSSSDPSVATVSADGLVTSVANGSAEVVVASACCEVADTVAVTVDEPAVVRVDASPSAMGFSALGAQEQIDVTLFDARENVVSGSVSWTSADPLVASVDGSGVVTAVSNGSTRVVAAAGCCDVADTVDVVVHEPVLAYIAADPKSVDLTVGDTTELSAAGFDTAGDTADVELTWASTDQSIAEVDQVGTLIAKGQGIAAIVVAAACCTAADTVLVGIDEEPITPSRVEASWEDIRFRALEQTFQLEATAFDEQERTIVDARYTWTSTDPSVASVDSMGLVTARANGIAAIVLASTCCTVPDTVPVTVDQEVSSIIVNPASVSLSTSQSEHLSAAAFDFNGFEVPDAGIAWWVMDSGVASIDADGNIVGMSEGETTAGASSSDDCCASVESMPAEVVVQSESVQDLYPHQPGGMTVLAQWDGTSKSLDGWGTWGEEVDLVSDTTNPLGTNSVLQFNYEAGSRSAGVLTADTFEGGPFSEIYIMYRIKYAPDWEMIGHKNFYWGAATGSRNNVGSPTQYYTTYEANLLAKITQQNAYPTSRVAEMPDAWAGDNGFWVNLEIYAVAESSPGAGDGAVYYYHNGVLLDSNTAVRWTNSDDPISAFDGFQWYAKRNAYNTRPSWFRVGELLISGR